MMCVDNFRLKETLEIFGAERIDYLHIDVMDGTFVPNLALGTDYVRGLREATSIPLDIHLMVENPAEKIGWFDPRPGDLVSVHVEATPHLQRVLQQIRDRGAKAAAAVNPATPLSSVRHVLADLDALLIMTVNPGYAGQKLIPETLEKIREFRDFADEKGYPGIEIEADGNVNPEHAKKMIRAGADILVLGSSGLFLPGLPLDRAIRDFRREMASAMQGRDIG
jgi:ribulose-phosphate 3-epimerase